MEFKVEKKQPPQRSHGYTREDIDLAYKFSKIVLKEFGRFLRAVVLFGSKARNPQEPAADIDVLLIVDDVSYVLSKEVVEAYRLIVEKTVYAVSTRLHVTTLRFTSFWEYMRVGDPIGINILRDGFAMVDTGFFSPLQLLLHQGRIRPTKEAVISYYSRVPQTMHNSKWHVMQAVLDLYWAAIDAAHASLMKAGEMPQNPGRIAGLIDEKLVKPGHVHRKCAKIMEKLYGTSKKILHRDIREMSGKEYDRLLSDAGFFVSEMRKYLLKKGEPL